MAIPTPQISPLESHLGYWLRHVSNHVSQAFARKVEAHGVTVAEWVLLRELHDGDAMPSTLAERLGMTRGAISKLADRLLEKALITRQANAEDRRAQILALLPAGRQLVPQLAALADQNDQEFFGHLDVTTWKLIEATLRDIALRRALKAVPVD